jgi:hypothetical protein
VHLATHGRFCNECNALFSTHWLINDHARTTGHQAYRCTECDASFSRLDVLGRHRQEHQPIAKIHSCDYCKKWRAPNGFRRKDHLTQHLRNYHHFQIDTKAQDPDSDWLVGGKEDPGFRRHCLHEGCPLFRHDSDGDKMSSLFPTRSAFTAHMKKEHDKSIYPCSQPGCARINGKGFFRERDLMKHMRRVHSINNDSDDEEFIPQASAPRQQASTLIDSTSSEASLQENFLGTVSTGFNTTGDVEAALKVLRSKGYIVEKDPSFLALSTN